MNNNSRNNLLFVLLLAAAVVSGMLISWYSMNRQTGRPMIRTGSSRYADNKLVHALALIDRLYVDTVNLDSLTEKVMPKLLAELDPHSVYIPARDYAEANESLEGEFDGVGVVFNMSTDTVLILNVIPMGPSDKAGVRGGDRIIMIDDSLVAGKKMLQTDVMKMLRGPRGTKVKLSIERQGVSSLVPITVTRGVIHVKSIDAAFMLTSDIGFVKLTSFSKNSHSEMRKALSKLQNEGMTKLIFDLRGNSGGFMDQAFMIANEFLPSGKMIVYTEDRYGKREEQFSNGRGEYQKIPLVILIDEGSASSSEILAGAIQDNDRGTIVGRRSFGKGLVQQPISFNDGSSVRLTVARYYTPTGRSIQKPYHSGDEEAYASDIVNRYNHSEFFTADSILFDDNLKYVTQGGKTVYGGGGIMSDVFVPLDTSRYTPYYIEVTGKNILFRFTLDYADRNREAVNAARTIPQVNAMLDSEKDLLNEFVRYAARQGVAPNYAQINKSRALILAALRAYIARNTPLEESGYVANIYTVDNTILKALEVLGEPVNVK